MDIKTPTIVTALFDIGRDKWDNFNLSYHTYLHWMENLLMIQTNMVIYTDSILYEDIIQMRKKYDTDLAKTKVVIKEVCELEGYTRFGKSIFKVMQSNEFKRNIAFNVPEMTKPMYNIIMFNKLFFLNDCLQHNYFNSDMLIWTDAACYREKLDILNWPDLNKVNALDNSKITMFTHSNNVNIGEPMHHVLSQVRFIQGGCFLVPINQVKSFVSMFISVVTKCIEAGYVGSDEKMFDLCYTHNQKAFNLIKCNWREYYNLFK